MSANGRLTSAPRGERFELRDCRHVGIDRGAARRGFGDQFRQAVIGLRADDQVDHRRTRLGLGAFRLGDAAGERDHRPRAVLAPEAADVRIGLVGGLFADVTGIEDDQVGILVVGCRAQALGAEQLAHALAVIDVHLAAEAFDPECFRNGRHEARAYTPAGRIPEGASATAIAS